MFRGWENVNAFRAQNIHQDGHVPLQNENSVGSQLHLASLKARFSRACPPHLGRVGAVEEHIGGLEDTMNGAFPVRKDHNRADAPHDAPLSGFREAFFSFS